jgi:hypothetical protein
MVNKSMTPADPRAQCIEAQTDAFIEAWYGHKVGHRLREEVKLAITAAFDALNGLAVVCAVDDVKEITERGLNNLIVRKMVPVACDLTNPQEPKP